MTSQKALYCIYCYWLTKDNSAMGQLRPFSISIQHSTSFTQHIIFYLSNWEYQCKSHNNSYSKNWNTFILRYHLFSNQNLSMITKKNLMSNFGSKLNHKPVKHFTVFILSQSHLLLFSQSGSSPPGINRLLSHCALFC